MAPTGAFDDESSEHHEDFYGLGYLDFADSRYLITKSSVIIGRPGDDHLALGEVSDGSDGRTNGQDSSRKRKRSDDEDEDEDMDGSGEDQRQEQGPDQNGPRAFTGGLGGPQEHGFSYYDGQDTNYIYVWPPANKETGLARNVKAISKRHLRLTLTTENDWLLDVLGRNGVIVNHDFFPCGSHTWLDHGDILWFAGVQCQFNIPEPDGDEVLYSDGDDYMSGVEDPFTGDSIERFASRSEDDIEQGGFDDDDDDDDEEDDDDDEEEEDDDDDDEDEDEEEDADDDDDEEEEEGGDIPVEKPLSRIKLTAKLKPNAKSDSKISKPRKPYQKRRKQQASESDEEGEAENTQDGRVNGKKTTKAKAKTKQRKSNAGLTSSPPNDDPDNPDEPQKKRGPGRPPKDGVMSKRARRAMEKAREMENGDGASKRKTKPRKPSEVNGEEAKSATKKTKKPKRTAGEDGENPKNGETNTADDKAKEEAPPPPPREPSPKETDFSEEQLMKPDRPYSVCLYKVLSESSRPLALPEIYEEFKKRWPYYRFRVSGEGWQSSIRHNLQSTKCVVQAGRHGKGHLWTVDPNIPLDHRTTNRINPPSFSHPYYGAAGKPNAPDFQGQGQQLNAIRPPNVAGFQGQQSMAAYQTAYPSQATPYSYNQRPPVAGQQSGSASMAAANNSPATGAVQQGAMQGHRNVGSGTPATGIMAPNGTQAQGSGRPVQPTTHQQLSGGATKTPGSFSQQNMSHAQQISNARPAPVAPQVTNSGQTQVNGNVQTANSGAGSGLIMDESLMRERLQVFDQFRHRLLGMAQNENQRRYYVDILDQGQQWCSKNTRMGATYDGPRSDIGQIVKAFQEAWEGHLRKKGLLRDQGARPQSGSPAPIISSGATAGTVNRAAPVTPMTSNTTSTTMSSTTAANTTPASQGVVVNANSAEPAAIHPSAPQADGLQKSQPSALAESANKSADGSSTKLTTEEAKLSK